MTRTVLSTALSFTAIGCSCRSFQFIVRPLFPGLPCFTKPFLPCPVLVSRVCVPLCSRALWFLCLRSGSVPVHRCSVFVLRLCSCSGVLILLPSRLVRFRGLEYRARFLGVHASCLTAVLGHVWLLATSHGARTTCLPSPSCHL